MAGEASDLAQRVHEHPNGRDLTTLGRLVLTGIATYRLDHAGAANLIHFLDPEEIAGTRLNSIDKADGNIDPWPYLLGITEGTIPSVSITAICSASAAASARCSPLSGGGFGPRGGGHFHSACWAVRLPPHCAFGMLCAVGLFAGELFELLLMPALLGLRLRKPRQAVTAP